MCFFEREIAADNNMIGLELFQQIHESNSQNLALKLDLSKAFDKIVWSLIIYILPHMNFPETFIQ